MNMNDFLRDCKQLGYLFIAALVIFKILLISETFLNTLMAIAAFFWLFIIPGFFMAHVFGIEDFIERFIIGILLGAALVGISAYYLGIIGVHVKYSAIILPPIFAALSIWLENRKKPL